MFEAPKAVVVTLHFRISKFEEINVHIASTQRTCAVLLRHTFSEVSDSHVIIMTQN
jgi:hypothetical protein